MRDAMTERFENLFARLAQRREGAFVPFVNLCDPDPGTSLAVLETLVASGADALIVSDLGITLAQYNVSNAISTVVSVVGSLVIGHVADKVSGRVLGSLTVIATSAVLAGMSFVGEPWQVYVLFSVRSVLSAAALEAE